MAFHPIYHEHMGKERERIMPATLTTNQDKQVNVGSYRQQSEREVRNTFEEFIYQHYQDPRLNNFHPIPVLNDPNKRLLEVIITAWKNNVQIEVIGRSMILRIH